jgi:dihydrolipoamide dehydrogenase
MANQSRDLIVLGSGPGGYVAAIRAAQLGRQVAIIERESLGGVCLNWGCIPSKALLRSAQLYNDMKHASTFGFGTGQLTVDFPRIIERSREVASKLSGGVSYLMRKNKIEVISGNGVLEKGNKVVVTDSSKKSTTYDFKDLIIATGARPRPLPTIDIDGNVVHTSRTILESKRLPKKLLVIGAGAIGIEFAYFFNSLGTQVTVVEMVDQILPVEDTEVAQTLEKVFTKNGMQIRTGTAVQDLKRSGDVVSATLKGKNGEEKWSGDACLIAIGILPNTENIGLEKVGIETNRGFVKVDEFMRTNVPHHFAIGDVAGGPALAHKASHEGLIAAEVAAGKSKHAMKYDNIPGCTYCQPQVASVGLTERAAKEKGIKYRVGKMPFSAVGKAIAIGEQDGFVKVIIDDEVGEVLGVHIIHAEATELISEAAVIRSHEGIAASVLDTVHPHPTLSEAVMEAMGLALGRPINF